MDPLRHESRDLTYGYARGTAYRRRIGGGMLIAGGALAFLTLAVPHPAGNDETAVIVTGALALAIGVFLLLRPELAPVWATPVFVALGTVLITLTTRLAGVDGTRGADNEVLYLIVVIYAFYFLPARQAFMQLGFIAVAYGLLLSEALPTEIALSRWGVTLGTLTVAGMLVRSLNERVEVLIGELNASARRDPLTGTLNRRGLDERLDIEVARARRTGEPLTIVTADLDGLKEINDRHGHRAGDEALQLAADVMANGLRSLDALARTGGDEFVIILPNCLPDAGLAIAEGLRRRLRERSGDESAPATLSVGVAGAPTLPLDGELLLTAADRALYRAKADGRDRAALAVD
ncbi:GGDEF domain-containing protein [soil metagenome]